MKPIGFFLLLFLFQYCRAQFPGAIVYTSIGTSSVTHEGQISRLKQYDCIFDQDVIALKKGAELMLLTKENKYLPVTASGTWTLNQLRSTVEGKPTGIVTKYFKLVWEDFFKKESNQVINEKSIGGAIGGAPRGDCPTLYEPPDNYRTDDDTLYFRWPRKTGPILYNFILADETGVEIRNLIQKDTSFYLLKHELLKGEKRQYKWTVTGEGISPNSACEPKSVAFMIYSAAQMMKEIDELIRKVPKGNDDFIYYMKISNNLGINGFYTSALAYYLKAKESFNKTRL